jgi:hypothetical protein
MNAQAAQASGNPATGLPLGKILYWAAVALGALLTLLAFANGGFSLWPVLNLLLWGGALYFLARFVFEQKSSLLNAALVAGGAVVGSIILLLLATPGAVTVNVSTGTGLSYDETRWARQLADGGAEPISGNSFRRGEVAMLFIRNVRGLEAGEDGRHWLDVDLVVHDASGNAVQTHQSLLGEQGHQVLPGGVAEQPFVFINTGDLPSGSYSADVTVHDRIAGTSISVSGAFTVQ